MYNKHKKGVRRFTRLTAVKAIIGLLAFCYLVLAALIPIALPVFGFDSPSGPYSIDKVSYRFLDESGKRHGPLPPMIAEN